MLQQLSVKYNKGVAWCLLMSFYLQLVFPLYVSAKSRVNYDSIYTMDTKKSLVKYNYANQNNSPRFFTEKKSPDVITEPGQDPRVKNTDLGANEYKPEDIGGPSSPESQSFKAVGADNLVNLFTGDFSYSLALMDVGGYAVNIFYNGGITMEQEASWVGLGWNINPGTVSRNMRGVPDDFNGDDLLVQKQNTKPNRTWGGEVGINGELIGIPQPKINLTLGFSYNNYLGPALDLGASVSLTMPIFENVKGAKAAPTSDSVGGGINLGLGAKLNSRSGLTLSPSLGANLDILDSKMDLGVKLSTSYNSRTGIKDLNLTSQTTAYRFQKKEEGQPFNYNAKKGSLSGSIGSTTFSFARPSYIPTLRMPMENANYSGQLELGGGMFGIRGGGTASGYYSESKVPSESRIVKKPLVGFLYLEKANNNQNAVMDFNRVNDAEVTPRTPIISAPQYGYDIFSIQGEGTGGSVRAYRSDMGFVRDNVTTSKDKNISLGFDIAPPGHYGGNWNIISMPTRVGGWEDANNTLQQTMEFQPKKTGSFFENVYFRNPGEATVTSSEILDRVGGDNLVRFKLGGSNVTPRLESKLELFSKNNINYKGLLNVSANTNLQNRDKRTQVVTMLKAGDAAKYGLEKQIRNYTGTFDVNNTIQYDTISRVGGFRREHHISEIDVLEQSGMRYIYGIPVYDTIQKDFTFSVNALPANPTNNLVAFTSTEPTISSEHMENKAKLDGYVQTQETPGYASAFLITGLLSPDYVDVTGNGITEDDLGGSVKFNYTKSASLHKWRTPRNNSTANFAHFNEGTRTEKKDNKATISYGEREAWYLNSIESKAMIAIFKTENRRDAKGVLSDMDGRVNGAENANKRLSRIDLYTKAEIKEKGITNAVPLKTVRFEYDYTLCQGTPDNDSTGGGKLTLKAISISYNGQIKQVKDRYVFNYGNTASQFDNPSYQYNASDRWGTYKKDSINPSGLTNSDYSYTSGNKAKNDEYAAAWSLKKILLPSGGQIEVQYEADDYAYVQNRRAANMFNIFGLGKTTSYTTNNGLYPLGLSSQDNFYVYVQLPQGLQETVAAKQKEEINSKYLEGVKQLAFKLLINMPKGPEPLTVYAEYEDYGVCPNSAGKDHIYIKLKEVDGKSPLTKSSIGYLTENLPGQAFDGYDVEVDGVAAFVEMVGSMLVSLKNAFKNVENQMRDAGKGRTIVLSKSFVRLDNPVKKKFGGGVRVKRVTLKDNWSVMANKYTTNYGQDYDYTTTEKINGKETVISSGVASYEPGIGSEENPFREIVAFNNKMPLASAQYGAIEMPMLEALYPSPSVGYSKVTVRSIHRKGTHGDSTVRSAIGKQVTEFFTAREFPTTSVYTPLSVMDYNKKPLLSLLYKEIINRRTLSQGFLVETNDMHGKMKAQLGYSESDEKTPLNATYYTYKNTGKNGLNDKVDYVFNEEGGTVRAGNIGIDVELMTDVREFRVLSNGFNGQIQTDFFTYVPWPIFVIPMLPLKTYMENKYRAVTCTKLINYHAIEDSMIIIDKGSVISTKTIAYDAETGAALVTQMANEFKDPVYTASYPAYWAYSGMAPAYKNIGVVYSNVNFTDGKITSGIQPQDIPKIFESGDELFIADTGTVPGDNCGANLVSPSTVRLLWVVDKNKNTSSLTNPSPDFVFIDSTGKIYTRHNVTIKIIRSGKRNMLSAQLATISSRTNPITGTMTRKLIIDGTSKVINANAVEYKEKWQTDNDLFRRMKLVQPPVNTANLITNGNFSSGNTGFTTQYTYNPSSGFNAGVYNVGSNILAWHSGMANCSDHSGLGGNMMMVNGSTTAGRIVWSQTVSVNPNSVYTLYAWAQHITFSSPATLQFLINGVQVGSILALPNTSCFWQQFMSGWNSQSNTTATISIINTNTASAGSDFALDDISFVQENCNEYVEIEDCSGYLEKNINAYRKGLLGTFRTNRSMVFYGERVESDVSETVNSRQNGLIKDFKLYWDFNVSNNLVPDIASIKWVWNSQVTRTNARGLELETKDALNIYTGAQYGFNKTLPVAVANNSRYEEMMNEGFEDATYKDNINNNQTNSCALPHIDLKNVFNSRVVNTDTAAVRAHSGKFLLAVNGNSTAQKQIKVTGIDAAEGYSIIHAQESKLGTLINQGVNVDLVEKNPVTSSVSITQNDPTNGLLMAAFQNGEGIECYQDGGYNKYHFYHLVTSHYVQITQCGTYNITAAAQNGFSQSCGAISFKIYTVDGAQIPTTFVGWSPNMIDRYEQAQLIPGVYKIVCDLYGGGNKVCQAPQFPPCLIADRAAGNLGKDSLNADAKVLTPPNGPCTESCGYQKTQFWRLFFSNASMPAYSNTNMTNGCAFTKPLATTDSMLNPTFKVPVNKRMLFSTWVKENCGNPQDVLCTTPSYLNSRVLLQFTGGTVQNVDLRPAGPIIEGWQRIEGEFTAPEGTTNMNLRFVNTGSNECYFDDIRIHPYNSNMKSYVYDSRSLRLSAELDNNNYASFYEYDEEGQLIRVKRETVQGIKTIKESRSAKQKNITDLQ